MDSFLSVAGVLLVICVGLVIAAATKSKPKQTGHGSTPPAPPPREERQRVTVGAAHRHPWVATLLGLSLAANLVLAILLSVVANQMADAEEQIEATAAEGEDQIDEAIAEGQDRIDAALAAAVATIPDTASLERNVAAEQRTNQEQELQLDRLETMISQLTAFRSDRIDPSDIDTPLFCSGEIAVWGGSFSNGLTC